MIKFAILTVLLATSPAVAQKAWIVGDQSCAAWTQRLLGTVQEQADRVWIIGFWSGLNMATAHRTGRNSMAGGDTDGPGIVGEVRKECSSSPSTSLSQAIVNVFYRMKKATGES
jgi:hypothetical protein